MDKKINVNGLPRWLASALLALGSALAGCTDACQGVNCAPCGLDSDDVQVQFDSDTLRNGFREAELRGAYIVRYRAPGLTRPRDTVRWQAGAQPGSGFGRYGLSLGQLRWPKTLSAALVLPVDTLLVHNYRVVLPAAARHYDLSSLEVRSAIGTGGCCNCSYNVRRRLLLNGQPVVADGGGGDALVVLRR